jgi:hypothetical protein
MSGERDACTLWAHVRKKMEGLEEDLVPPKMIP